MTDYTQGMHHYDVYRCPYVMVTFPDQPPIHAQVLGWNGDMIMISAPEKLYDRYSWTDPQIQWVHKSQATRIRQADSIWISMEDDHEWHAIEDGKIVFRPDGFTIYGQDNYPK